MKGSFSIPFLYVSQQLEDSGISGQCIEHSILIGGAMNSLKALHTVILI